MEVSESRMERVKHGSTTNYFTVRSHLQKIFDGELECLQIVRVFTNPSLRAFGREKRFQDFNRLLETSLFKTVISRSISCNLEKKIRQH